MNELQIKYNEYEKEVEKDKEAIKIWKKDIKNLEKELEKRQRWLKDAEYSYKFHNEILNKIKKDMKEAK